MAKQKYWNGTVWEVVGTDANKVSIQDAGNIITATDVEGALQEIVTNFNVEKADYTLQVPYAGVTTGAANTYAIATPTIAALTTGMAVSVKFNLDSTGASTLNWNGKGAKGIKKANGTDATNLKAAGIYTLRYDGTNFILQGEGASGNATASDLLSGKTASTDAGDITGTLALTGTATAADIVLGKTAYTTDPKNPVTGTYSNIKSIQRGSVAFAATATQVVTLAAVDLTKAVVMINYSFTSNTTPDAADSSYAAVITDSTTLTITRKTGTSSDTHTVNWTVVEFYNVKSLQTGSYLLALTGTVTVSNVDPLKSLLFVSAIPGTAGSFPEVLLRATITNGTTLTFVIGTTSNLNVKWQLIEFY
ncbi:MAG: hypothetical protein A2Y34_04330 [Spirochaetes bacterium GWC1_27_15]|nr:MAG: hypothetical protein A2Y34_04330 [Spirochaetes bacterium GWC1_27_15]